MSNINLTYLIAVVPVFKDVGMGGGGLGGLHPPSQLRTGEALLSLYLHRYLDKYLLSCACPRVINTGASVACTATGCK